MTVPAPIAATFDALLSPGAWTTCFRGFGLLVPRIVAVAVVGGDGRSVGSERRVDFADGTHILERIVAFAPPRRHDYEIARLAPLPRLFLASMVSRWELREAGDATAISWRYELTPKARWMLPLAALAAWGLGRAMRRFLGEFAANVRLGSDPHLPG